MSFRIIADSCCDRTAKLNVTNSSVCDWERGRVEPSLEMLVAIAKFFEVSVDYLLGLED